MTCPVDPVCTMERATRYSALLEEVFDYQWDSVEQVDVLDLGCGDGCWARRLARLPVVGKVVAVDARTETRATKPDEIVESPIAFVQAEAISYLATCVERGETFDLIFCAGLLYHLTEPWLLLERCAQVAPWLLLDTELALPSATDCSGGVLGEWHGEDPAQPRAGLENKSFWLTERSLMTCLEDAGYTTVLEVKVPRDRFHPARKGGLARHRPIFLCKRDPKWPK